MFELNLREANLAYPHTKKIKTKVEEREESIKGLASVFPEPSLFQFSMYAPGRQLAKSIISTTSLAARIDIFWEVNSWG